MTYEAIKYPNRCIVDLFGYCKKKGIKGEPITNQETKEVYAGTAGTCDRNPAECSSYVTNTVANPFREELVGAKFQKAKQ